MKKQLKWNKLFYEIVVMVLPVMLGVYLGLLANDWNEERKENQKLENVLKSMEGEILHNQEVAEESLSYFRQLADSIYHLEDKSVTPSSFSFWKGLNPPLLKNASFQTAMLTGVLTNLDIETLEQLGTSYSLQEDLKEQTNTYVQSITSKIGSSEFDNRKYLIILENYAHDQIYAEETLVKELEKTLKAIRNRKN